MSGVTDRIPTNPSQVRVRYPLAIFSAAFDGFSGLYDFEANPANRQELMALQSNSVYLIETFSLFANVPESAWLEAMLLVPPVALPQFFFSFSSDVGSGRGSLFPEPMRAANFQDGVKQLVYFKSTADSNSLFVTMAGRIGQSAGMVGVDPLIAEVNFVMYQITDEAWNAAFNEARRDIGVISRSEFERFRKSL